MVGPAAAKHGGRRTWLAGAVAAVLLTMLVWQRPWVTAPRAPAGGPVTPAISTLAMLPLKNLTGDPGQEYFVDGLTEALASTFSQMDRLTVISSTSAMRYKNTAKTAPQIAKELGGV